MRNNIAYIIIAVVVLVIIIIVLIHLSKKKKLKYYKNTLEKLEINKNLVGSIPIGVELAKVEALNKNQELDEKCKEFHDRENEIKNVMIPHIDDMLIDLDTFFDKKDFQSCDTYINNTEIEIYKVREYANNLLAEIKEITSSDEKYRSMITKLKTKYRSINNDFQNHKNIYDEMQDAISMQLENIEKRFLDFEKAMDTNSYTEVLHIIKALTTMIDHISVIIGEVPDLVLMCKQVIPNKLKEVEETNKKMIEEGYVLGYLNIDYNLKETRKNIENILDRIRVLNLEDCMFEVKTILDYTDSLFVDFEKERLSRKVFEEMNSDFEKKLNKTNKVVEDVTSQLDKIKNMYDMRMEDVDALGKESKTLIVINDDYNKTKKKLKSKSTPYSELHKDIEDLTNRLKDINEEFDSTLKSLGTMYDDEQRAREQLEEIEKFLSISKDRIHSYKLPVISDKYFTELNEAREAIGEVIKELSKKPIVISTLNTRVDTARDLVLKLYNTTNDLIRTACFTEELIIYANRFRDNDSVKNSLDSANNLYFRGKYNEALSMTFDAIKRVNSNIYRDLVEIYESK